MEDKLNNADYNRINRTVGHYLQYVEGRPDLNFDHGYRGFYQYQRSAELTSGKFLDTYIADGEVRVTHLVIHDYQPDQIIRKQTLSSLQEIIDWSSHVRSIFVY